MIFLECEYRDKRGPVAVGNTLEDALAMLQAQLCEDVKATPCTEGLVLETQDEVFWAKIVDYNNDEVFRLRRFAEALLWR